MKPITLDELSVYLHESFKVIQSKPHDKDYADHFPEEYMASMAIKSPVYFGEKEQSYLVGKIWDQIISTKAKTCYLRTPPKINFSQDQAVIRLMAHFR